MERKRLGDEDRGHGDGAMSRGHAWLEVGYLLGPGFRLLFTDRTGGVSEPPYDEMNLAFHTGDDPSKVAKNRAILARWIGLGDSRMIYPQQVHGLSVAWLEGTSVRSVTMDEEVLRGKDGLISTESGLALSVLTADCVPLALAYPERGIVAVLHAGWRGTIGDIASIACRLIEERTGAKASEARAVMGPCIGPCCYEVDKGRAEQFVEKYPDGNVVFRHGGAWSLDLKQANIVNLKRCGIEESAIHLVGGCTCCEPRYYSFRRDGITGRQGAFLWREEKVR